VDDCAEVSDGDIFWEDHAIYCGDRAAWSEDFKTQHGWIIRHIDRSRTDRPHLTHFILSAVGLSAVGLSAVGLNPRRFDGVWPVQGHARGSATLFCQAGCPVVHDYSADRSSELRLPRILHSRRYN
jgi:hypothetical protein